MGYHLQRALQDSGVECVVIAPSSIARAPGDRVKTDRGDAVAIARLLRNGEGQRVYVPTPEDEAVRDYLRCRDDLRQELRRYRQRLQQCLIRHGHVYRGGRNWTQSYRRWLGESEFSEEVLAETVQIYYRRIQEREEKLSLMAERIQQLASSARYAEPVARLRCFRGIDYLTALALVCEVGDFRRFATAPKFMGFLGMVPSERTSGSRPWQGGITKTGKRSPAAAVGGGGMALSQELFAEQGVERAPCRDARGADRARGARRAPPGAEVWAHHRAASQAAAGGGDRTGAGTGRIHLGSDGGPDGAQGRSLRAHPITGRTLARV